MYFILPAPALEPYFSHVADKPDILLKIFSADICHGQDSLICFHGIVANSPAVCIVSGISHDLKTLDQDPFQEYHLICT